MLKDCNKPKDQDRINRNKEKFLADKDKKGGQQPRHYGNKNNRGNNNNNRQQGGGTKQNIMKVPPKRGESHEHMWKGRKQLWCGKCGNWNYSHLTANHVDNHVNYANVNNNNNNNNNGNGNGNVGQNRNNNGNNANNNTNNSNAVNNNNNNNNQQNPQQGNLAGFISAGADF